MARKKAKPELPAPVMSLADLSADLNLTGEAILSMVPPSAPPSPPPETIPTPDSGPRQADVLRARKALIELRLRQMEALRLYEPLPKIDASFHRVLSQIRSIRGSNRSSKTTGAAVEIARAATAQDPYGKYPKTNGRIFAIGQSELQVATVLYPKLFKPGAFNIIKDEETKQWRVYRPWTDKHRAHEKRPAPPLIPKRFIKGEPAWKDKKLGVPSKVELTTGWTIHFFASGGVPPGGVDIDIWWIDEECENQLWYSELCARILDRKGRGIWSATPQVANPQLYELHLRAAEDAASETPQVTECYVLLADNPYIDQEDKDKFAANMTDEERRVRIQGEFRLSGFRVYPEFDMKIHGYEGDGWQVPLDWSRYLVVDPGRQVCAVLFAAVPPHNKMVLLYDELYMKQCDAEMFGRRVASKSQGVVYERMLIDNHAGRVPDMGYGIPVGTQYGAALKRHKVESKIGYCFIPGNDDPDAGILKVRTWMHNPEVGGPRLRVLKGRLPNLEKEIERYHYQRVMVKGEFLVTDKPEKKNDHLMDCLRYLAMFEPRWAKPKKPAEILSPAVRALHKKRAEEKRASREGGSGFIRLGPNSKRAA